MVSIFKSDLDTNISIWFEMRKMVSLVTLQKYVIKHSYFDKEK